MQVKQALQLISNYYYFFLFTASPWLFQGPPWASLLQTVTKMVQVLRDKAYQERLDELNIYGLRERGNDRNLLIQ